MFRFIPALILTFIACIAHADSIVLVDGTVIECTTMIKRSDGYWVKLPSGESKVLPASQIKEVRKGSTANAGTAAAQTEAQSASFRAQKSRADRVDEPIAAVAMWEAWIDADPPQEDLPAANAELDRWQQLHEDNAERINGKWVGGAEKKRLIDRVEDLVAQGRQMLHGTQAIEGARKLEEALRLYPNSFDANFELGYHYLAQAAQPPGNPALLEKSVALMENAARLRPRSAACWSNLAIGYSFSKKYERAVQLAYKAVKIRDDKDTVQNLVNSIAHAPPGMQRNNTNIKPIVQDAALLARKHGIGMQGGDWRYIRSAAPDDATIVSATGDSEIDEGAVGYAWSGSGFLISPDGYLLTNQHVVTGEPGSRVKKNIAFRVRFVDGSEKNAELIAVDSAADIALLKVNVDQNVPFLKLADDNPRQASKLLVLGYPTTSSFRSAVENLQVAEGTVKSINPGDPHEVWMNLNTTHGNSGGPILDKDGRVVAILTAGRQVHNMTIVLGVGPNQVRRFLDSLGERAPTNVSWEPPAGGAFDGEKLTDDARSATLRVIAIRMAL